MAEEQQAEWRGQGGWGQEGWGQEGGARGEPGPVDRRPRKAALGRVRWSAKRKNAFLDHLAATCHVGEAAEVAGVSRGSAYGLRRRDPTFAAEWSRALQAGYEVLELRLVAHTLAGGGRVVGEGGPDGKGSIDVDLALKLLSTHRGAMLGKPHKGGPRPHVATREETTAAILKKLKIVEARYRRVDPAPPALIDGRAPVEDEERIP